MQLFFLILLVKRKSEKSRWLIFLYTNKIRENDLFFRASFPTGDDFLNFPTLYFKEICESEVWNLMENRYLSITYDIHQKFMKFVMSFISTENLFLIRKVFYAFRWTVFNIFLSLFFPTKREYLKERESDRLDKNIRW